jgi:hypothetical protein
MFHDLSRTNILATIIFSLLTCYFACLRQGILVTGISSVLPYYFTSWKRYSDKTFFISALTFLHLSGTRNSVSKIPPLLWNFLTSRTSCSGHRFLVPTPTLLHPSHGADILVPGFTFLFSCCFGTPGPDMLVTGFSFLFSWSLLEDSICWSQFLSCDTLRDLTGQLPLAKQGQCNFFSRQSSTGADTPRVL